MHYGLIIAAVLSSNWKLRFALDAPDLYRELYDEAADEAENDILGWLVSAAYGDHNLRPARKDHGGPTHVARSSDGVADSLLARRPQVEWALMAPRRVPPDQIKTPSIKIGIQEGRGGSTPPAPQPSGKQLGADRVTQP